MYTPYGDIMTKSFIGNNFYELLQNGYNAEDYTLYTFDGEEFTGKISLKEQRFSRVLEEKEFLLQGVATFPDIYAQESFRGCYFVRETDPMNTYILVSIVPEPTDGRIGTVYCVECNEVVTLANIEKHMDEKGDEILDAVPFFEDVKVYFDTTLQKQRRGSDGNFDVTSYFMQIPAYYGISEDQVVLRKALKWDDELKRNVLTWKRYRVEAVTLSMTKEDEEGNLHGILDVQMSVDTRG